MIIQKCQLIKITKIYELIAQRCKILTIIYKSMVSSLYTLTLFFRGLMHILHNTMDKDKIFVQNKFPN